MSASADQESGETSEAAAAGLGLRQRRGGGAGTSSGQPQEPLSCSASSSASAQNSYASDYASLLATEKNGRSVADVVQSMKRSGGKPALRKHGSARRVAFHPATAETQGTTATSSSTNPSDGDDNDNHVPSPNSAEKRRKSVLIDQHAESILQVDIHFRRAALGVCLIYPILVAFSYWGCPSDQIRLLEGMEKNAAGLAAILLFVSCLSMLLPLIFRGRGRQAFSGVIVAALVVQSVAFTSNCLMASLPVPVMIDPVAGTRVHLLRWCEWTPLAFLMTFLTEGVGIPDVDSSSISSKKPWRNKHLVAAYGNGLAQGFSTLCGLIFPFCPNFISWMFFMVVSCLLFLVIYYRLLETVRVHRRMNMGTSVDEMEVYNRSLLSLKLLIVCTFLWTSLVISYFLSTLGPFLFTEIDWMQASSLTMVSECTMDVIAKVLYTFIIVEVHDHVFDQGARAERRLEELRQMMAVVWDNSSDVIGISVRSINGTVTTMLSPTYLKIYKKRRRKLSVTEPHESHPNPSFDQDDQREGQGNALIFELDAKEFSQNEPSFRSSFHDAQEASPTIFKEASNKVLVSSSRRVERLVEPKIVHNIEFAAASRRRRASRRSSVETDDDDNTEGRARRRPYGNVTGYAAPERPNISPQEFSSVAELVVRAWDLPSKESLIMQDLVLLHKEEEHVIRCEAKVTRLEENALVIVVRDISERFRRFEAEKKVISETTAREKDAEANRFTRHEVKNGLLAAIGLCDSLRDTLVDKSDFTKSSIIDSALGGGDVDDMSSINTLRNLMTLEGSYSAVKNMPVSSGGENAAELMTDLSRCMGELDKTLHEVLDTILAEAMARDVIHEVYEPKLEKVDINKILCGAISVFEDSGSSRVERFPLITHPNPLPLFAFDPQLLKYIHRNAVSNGCKYGKKGGIVLTEVRYDSKSGIFHMDVINLPGEHHDKLLAMGEAASVAVFSPRQRLHSNFTNNQTRSQMVESHSSGDGAWIMHKCAKTLGGECSIVFERNRTVFSLRCPITTFEDAVNQNTSVHPSNFKLPENVWGIAIDDSKIQRKLLGRFFQLAGVKDERCIIQGETMHEIKSFDDFVVDHIEQHPNDYFVLIADENLDINEDNLRNTTVSGSMCIENVRHRLLPDQERRVLALVRSANDSSRDIAIYNSRAHGFLPKAPIQRQRVLEMLAPAWEKRFPPGGWADEDTRVESSRQVPLLEAEPIDVEDDEDLLVDMMELRAEVEELDAMCLVDEELLAERWAVIWERLHALKGDLKSLPSNGRAAAAIELITSLRGTSLPPNLKSKWATVHALVKSLWA